MTAVVPLEESGLLLELDHHFDIPCEIVQPDNTDCGQPAAWWFLCRSCGHAVAECDADRRNLTHRRWPHVYGYPLACSGCNASVAVARWRALFRYVPIHLGDPT